MTLRIALPLLFLALPAAAGDALTPDIQKETCQAVYTLAQERADIREHSQRLGWMDIDNDGTEEYLTYEKTGTGPAKAVITQADGQVFPPITLADDGKEAGLPRPDQFVFRHRGRVFLLSFHDNEGRVPDTVWHIAPNHVAQQLCTFETTKRITASKPDLNAQREFDVKAMCDAVSKQTSLEYAVLGERETLTIDPYQQAVAEVTLDINKDGESDRLYAIDYAKDGCRYRYFLPQDDIHPQSDQDKTLSPLGNQLYWAQFSRDGDPDGHQGTLPCPAMQDARLIRHGEHILLERGDLSTSPEATYHQVWLFRGAEKYELCHFTVEPDTHFTLHPLSGTPD